MTPARTPLTHWRLPSRGFVSPGLVGFTCRSSSACASGRHFELIVRLWVRALKSKTRTADDEAHSVQVFKHDAQRSGGPNYGSEGWGFDPSGRTIEIASRGGC
jgi:hypothetical protein